MAQRRMFSLKIIDTDAFLDMPQSTQLLYFHLCMKADDDGFVASPKRICRSIGCSDDDANILIAKRYVLMFKSGVVVIKHWKIHNLIRTDRYKETTYIKEKQQLTTNEYGAYTEGNQDVIPNGNQRDDILEPQVRLGKVRLGKDSIVYKGKKPNKPRKNFMKPSVDEIRSYIKDRKALIDAEQFFDYYETRGWMVGKNKMKDWKAAVRTWERNEFGQKPEDDGIPDEWKTKPQGGYRK